MSFYSLYFIIIISLFNLSSNEYVPCQYRTESSQTIDTAPYTDGKYLSGIKDDKERDQKCFSLSHSDLVSDQCCYYFNKSDNLSYCFDKAKSGYTSGTDSEVECPKESKIPNNCGLALFYQPLSEEVCTEISLVDDVCCYVETNSYGNVCLRQDSVDDDDESKLEITDYMKDYFRDKLKIDPKEIKYVRCEGNYFTFRNMILTLISLAVICL